MNPAMAIHSSVGSWCIGGFVATVSIDEGVYVQSCCELGYMDGCTRLSTWGYHVLTGYVTVYSFGKWTGGVEDRALQRFELNLGTVRGM